MRMRNLPWAKDYLASSPSVPSDLPQDWSAFFKVRRKEERSEKERLLHVELGAGKGGFSAKLAKLLPEDNFVALEKNSSAAALAAKRLDRENVQDGNLVLLNVDAAALPQLFKPGEIDLLHLNFSDPWPKKRTHKRRLTYPAFLETYKKVLKPQGKIIFKTDNAPFFNDSMRYFLDSGFRLEKIDVDYHVEENEQDTASEYELKFSGQGHPIYYASWIYQPETESQI